MTVTKKRIQNVTVTCDRCGAHYEFPNLSDDESDEEVDRTVIWWYGMYGWDVVKGLCPRCNKADRKYYYTVSEGDVSMGGDTALSDDGSERVFWKMGDVERHIAERKKRFKNRAEKNGKSPVRKWTVWEHSVLYTTDTTEEEGE